MANIKGIELASEIYDLEDTSARDTATTASQTATQAGQTAAQASQTATQASQTATQASETATQADEKIGDLTDLTTTAKTDLVSAINEVKGDIEDIDSLIPSGTTSINKLVNNNEVAPAITDVYIPNLQDSVTVGSDVSVDDLKFVQKGRTCFLSSNSVQIMATRPYGAVLFTLPSSVPAPKVGVYAMVPNLLNGGFTTLYISPSRQVSAAILIPKETIIAFSIMYLTE